MHDGDVREAEVLQFPEEAGDGIASRAEVAEERVRPAAKAAPGVGEGHARHERAKLRLLPPHQGRLDEFLRAGQLGAIPQALDDQVVERNLVGDQADDALGGSTGANTVAGLSTSRRTRLAEATSN